MLGSVQKCGIADSHGPAILHMLRTIFMYFVHSTQFSPFMFTNDLHKPLFLRGKFIAL